MEDIADKDCDHAAERYFERDLDAESGEIRLEIHVLPAVTLRIILHAIIQSIAAGIMKIIQGSLPDYANDVLPDPSPLRQFRLSHAAPKHANRLTRRSK
jgi:hypothetical protein